MKERVDVREWVEFQWPYLIAFLGGAARVQSVAEQTGAFRRARKIGNAEVLLRLILMWAVAERSLMDTAAIAAEAGLADVSDAALVKRFAKAGDWLATLVSDLLVDVQPTLRGFVERGDNVPTLTIIIQIAEGLGVEPADLLKAMMKRR